MQSKFSLSSLSGKLFWHRSAKIVRIGNHPGIARTALWPMIASGLLFCIGLGCALLPSPLLVLACLALLLLGVAALLRPRLALLLLFACAGLPAFVLPLPGHNMHLVEPVTLLLLIVVILHRPTLRPGIPHLLALLFLIIAVLSFIHAPILANVQSPYGADKRLLTLLIVIIAFFCGTWLAREVRRPSAFLSMLLLVNLPLYGIALAQVLGIPLAPPLVTGANPLQSWQDIQSVQGRLWGPFPWPANFGMYLTNLCAIALACWLQGTRRIHRLYGFLMTIVTVLTIAGSGTRSAMIAVVVILLLACLLTRRFDLLCGGALLTALLSLLFYPQILALFTHDATSTSNRLLLWNEAIRLIANNPWLGIGLEQFPYYYQQLIVGTASTLGPLGIHPHEQYLEWALESGIFWLLSGLCLLVSVLCLCWRAYHRLPAQRKCLQLAALLAMLANGIIGLFDVPLDQLEGTTLLFLLAGLALGQASSHKYPHKCPKNPAATTRMPSFPALKWHKQHKKSRPEEQLAENRPDTRKTGRAIFFQLLSWGIALPLILPVTALLTRYLGPERYGVYSLTFPFLTLFALFSGTALDPLLARQLSREPHERWSLALGYAVGTRGITTVLSVLAALSAAWLLPLNGEQRTLFWAGSFTLFFSFSFNGLRFVYTQGFRAEQRIGPLALLETANRLLTAALIVLVVYLRWPLLQAYILLTYSDLPMFGLLVVLAHKRYNMRIRFSLVHLRTQVQASLPLLGHQALALLGGLIDQSVLLFVAGAGPVGLYALASRVVDPLISIAFAYVNGLYPLLCVAFEEGREQFASVCYHAFRLLALAIVPLALCITMEAEVIVSVLGGKRFIPATIAVQLLIWAMTLTFLNQLAERACMAANQERRIPLVTVLATTTNLVLNVILIPHWQIMGAGIANLLSEGCAFCLFILLIKHYLHLRKSLYTLALILLSNLPALAFFFWQPTMSPLLSLPIAWLLVGIAYFLTRVLTWSDVRQARQFFCSQRQKQSLPPEKTEQKPDEIPTQITRNWKLADYPTLVIPRIHV